MSVAKNVDDFKRELWDRGARYDDSRPIPVALTPQYLSADQYESLSKNARNVQEAFEVISDLYCEDENIRTRFPELVELQGYILRTPQAQRKIGLARFDYVIATDQTLKMVESNADCPGGMAIAGIVHRAFRSSAFYDPQIQEISQSSEDALSFLHLMQKLSGKPKPRLGFIWSQVRTIMNDIQALYELAAQMPDWPAPYIGPVQALQQAADGTLSAEGLPIDFAFTKIDTTMAANGKIHWCAWQDSIDEAQPILNALASGALPTVNGLTSMMVVENKRTIALLFESDVRENFTEAQRQAIDRTVARTTRLDADPKNRLWSPKEVLEDKDRFVLKTPIDTRGRGIHIGRVTDAQSWQDLVEQACVGHFVVQEYIAPRMEWLVDDSGQREYMSTVLALYLYGAQATGIFGRASAAAVVNVGNGGFARPALIVR